MDFGETFPIKNSSFKEFTLFLFDINQRHGKMENPGPFAPSCPNQIDPLNPI